MNNYKYQVVYTTKFKKSLKRMLKQNKDLEELLDIVDKLAVKEKLDNKYKNHKLVDDNNYKNCFECHIRPDWLLVYEYLENTLVLLLINTGSHSDLFDK